MKKIKIQIQNGSNDRMSITKEPEAIQGFISVGDIIDVETNEEEDNILINVGKNDDGTIFIQIWDARNTRYTINHKGKNMFEEYLQQKVVMLQIKQCIKVVGNAIAKLSHFQKSNFLIRLFVFHKT